VSEQALPTLLIGAGDAARELARALLAAPEYGLAPIGFLDDNADLETVLDLPVFGRLDDLREVAAATRAKAALVAIPSLPASRIAELVNAAAASGLLVRHLPSFLAAVERDIVVSDLRGIRVDELLGRRELHVTSDKPRTIIRGKRVLVTGAGGSIGSELCRQISRFEPAAVYLLDHDESNLHSVYLDLAGSGLLDSDEIIIADIRDQPRLAMVFDKFRPEIVFHAAAHKHLPLLERHPGEAVKSNVLGTQHLVDLAVEHGVERFVLISTDKAADPTSVLGASKRIAELIVRRSARCGTAMASVRFGNVLGSRGSVLAVLASQFASRQAITVTHPDVTRFFMTIEEAVGLVLEAMTMAADGETFVLDMGEPVSIVELVHRYAAAANVANVEIEFTGLRPGEKLNEKLFSDAETTLPTPHAKIYATRGVDVPADLSSLLTELYAAANRNDDEATVKVLHRILPDYQATAHPVAPRQRDAPYPDGF